MRQPRDPFTDELITLLPRLRRFAMTLGGEVNADDLVQEACEKAIRSRDQFIVGGRLDSWMYKIIQNLWIDRCRAAARRPVAQDIDEVGDIFGTDGERNTMATIDYARVRARIAELPDDQRVVLGLVTIEGLTYRDAAEALGIPIGTVMSRLARARKALHQMLRGEACYAES
jgi:RNA polymerase sigma-70 factor (ECF subfamily)